MTGGPKKGDLHIVSYVASTNCSSLRTFLEQHLQHGFVSAVLVKCVSSF